MKRCPECGREYDNTMMFCLDDGAELLYGPASADEPATAILSEPAVVAGGSRQLTDRQEPKAAILQPSATDGGSDSAGRFDKRLLLALPVLAVLILGGFFGYRYFNPNGGQINSIAVLPFSNASGDKEADFLADGIAETLINNFTKIPELKVAARSTAFRYRGREGEPREVGRELGVGSILTGRLLQQGDSLSVQVDLIDTTDGSQIWGNRYEGRPADIVGIQQRIATDVSSRLKLKLTGAQTQQLTKTFTENPEAYQRYLRGRYHWNKRTADDLRKGLSEFQQAADLDPGYPLAYVGLADTWVLLEEYAGVPSKDCLPRAEAFAKKALEMDDSIGEAHASLGLTYTYMWQWAEAERELKRAIELNPNYPTAHHWYSVLLHSVGRTEEGMAEIKKAQQLDPLSAVIGVNVGIIHLGNGDSKAAATEFKRIVEFDPNWWGGHFYLGLAYLELGLFDEGVKEIRKGSELTNRTGPSISVLGYAYAIQGRRSEAIAIIGELEERFTNKESNGQAIAAVYAGLGDKDRAFEWLEKDFNAGSSDLRRTRWYPPLKHLRDDPRFKDLVKRMAFPD